MIIALIVSCIANAVLLFVAINLFRKTEIYEAAIEDFYVSLSVVLHTMRGLDDRQMFEEDDEVGSVFKQLSDIIFTLRPLLYGTPDEKEEN